MSRLKRIMKRLAIGFAILVALLLILNGAFSWHTGRQLEQRLAKLRAAGEPTTFAELAPEPIPPEQDAAVHLQRLAPQLEAFSKDYGNFPAKTFREDLTPEQIEAIREILSHYPELPLALDVASRCEGYASQIDYSVPEISANSSPVIEALMSGADGQRTPARFLHWKIEVLLAEGKQEEAIQTGLVILRLARHFDREPALVNALLAWAVRDVAAESINTVLRTGPISAELREELDQELAFHDEPAGIQQVMKTERAINLSASKGIFAEPWWLPWISRGIEVDMLDFHQRLQPILTQPWHKARAELQNINTEVSYSTPMSGTLMVLLEPALEAGVVAFYRSTAMLRCLRIVNSLAAYAQANGHEAAGLDDLDLPATAKIDPFTGQPLKLKWTDDGWVVYTVFKNGTDDGGDFKEQADWGLGPAGYLGAE